MGDLAAWWTLAWVVEGSFAEESFAAYHALVPSILRGLLPQPVLAAAVKVGIASSKNNERITNRQNLVEEARINSEVRPRGSSRTQTQTILSFPRISRQKNLPRLKEHLMQPVPKKNFNQECRVILWNTLPLLVLGHCVPESGGVQ